MVTSKFNNASMEFMLEGGVLKVILNEVHIAELVKHIAISKTVETGGILIGRYSEDLSTAEITQVTGPPKDSKSGPTWFSRGIKGLKSLLKKAWCNSEYYLGEWHFHPMGTTTPSGQDLFQMAEIANNHNYNCPEAIMIIIAGTAKNHFIKAFITDQRSRVTTPMNVIE